MIPGVPEATAVAQSGAAVLRGVRAVDRPAEWPNIREGLWELVEIMHQWHKQAEATGKYVRMRSAELRGDDRPQRRAGGVFGGGVAAGNFGAGGTVEAANVGGGSWRGGNYERVRADLRNVLNPPARLVNYLRPKRRRSEQRRSLRTVLRIYCPELLEECEAAFDARGEWVLRHRKNLDDWLASGPSDQERRQFQITMDDTADALMQAARNLTEFIRETFPLSDN